MFRRHEANITAEIGAVAFPIPTFSDAVVVADCCFLYLHIMETVVQSSSFPKLASFPINSTSGL